MRNRRSVEQYGNESAQEGRREDRVSGTHKLLALAGIWKVAEMGFCKCKREHGKERREGVANQ